MRFLGDFKSGCTGSCTPKPPRPCPEPSPPGFRGAARRSPPPPYGSPLSPRASGPARRTMGKASLDSALGNRSAAALWPAEALSRFAQTATSLGSSRTHPTALSESPEEKIRQLKKKVNELVEENCIANSCGDLKLVLFNVACQYSANEMYAEALNTYQVILKNKMFSNVGRIKIMQNIGVTFIKTGQYSDAINSFEHIMSMAPNLKAGFNLILSYFAIGDREKMKKAFQKLIAVPLEIDEDDKYISPSVSMKKTVI
ncbi:Intraflagellar transport protein 88-like protein [Sciurus carolinensis]|uniref:Intraflagellar transport protein 88-like protein n=1 Tax=Sciurus carolinensis TaxID=30640 RepID=A0AA41N8F7_SCICA|nr:Intraflagellar transport protein 88-like protein [Sciurus carolinensis]